jgi:hypothetical protein
VSELRAIELWDAIYKRNVIPFWYDHIAFMSRQKRRGEISSELQRMSDQNDSASQPVDNADVGQGQSEGMVRVASQRIPPERRPDHATYGGQDPHI